MAATLHTATLTDCSVAGSRMDTDDDFDVGAALSSMGMTTFVCHGTGQAFPLSELPHKHNGWHYSKPAWNAFRSCMRAVSQLDEDKKKASLHMYYHDTDAFRAELKSLMTVGGREKGT